MFPCEFVRIFVRTRSDTPTYCTCSNWSWPKSLHFAIFSSSLTKKPTSWQMIDMKIKEQGKIVVIESFLHFCNAISYIGYIVRADSVEEWWEHWICIPLNTNKIKNKMKIWNMKSPFFQSHGKVRLSQTFTLYLSLFFIWIHVWLFFWQATAKSINQSMLSTGVWWAFQPIKKNLSQLKIRNNFGDP